MPFNPFTAISQAGQMATPFRPQANAQPSRRASMGNQALASALGGMVSGNQQPQQSAFGQLGAAMPQVGSMFQPGAPPNRSGPSNPAGNPAQPPTQGFGQLIQGLGPLQQLQGLLGSQQQQQQPQPDIRALIQRILSMRGRGSV